MSSFNCNPADRGPKTLSLLDISKTMNKIKKIAQKRSKPYVIRRSLQQNIILPLNYKISNNNITNSH